MAINTFLVLVLVSILSFTSCAFVDTLSKCKIKDSKCHAELIQKVLHDIAEPGVPELNIPSVDPIKLTDIDLSILDVINMTLIDGTATGAKNCKINKYVSEVEHSKSYLDLTCDIIFKGKYKMHSDSPIFKNLLGGSLRGDGNGVVQIDKINIKFDYAYKLTKKADGDIYFIRDPKNSKYTWDIKDKVTFAADKLYLGDKEASKEVIGILNENWKVVVGSVGNKMFDIAVKFMIRFIERIFKNVSAKYFIIEDLSEYL